LVHAPYTGGPSKVFARSSREKGAQGEELARKYLKAEGFKILDVNFHARMGEIDIIAQDKNTIVFVEVKSAAHTSFGDPLNWIPVWKQERIIKASLVYLKSKGLTNSLMRYDVITVEPNRKVFSHVRDAFRPGSSFSL
jgi:putative endonuclease